MTDSKAVSKRFETPLLDSLKPMHKRLVEYYCVLLDKRKAAEAAGYTDNHGQLDAKVNELFTKPEIVAAIDEYLACKLEQLDAGRAAICERLFNQSLATIWDVAERVPYVNGSGKEIENKHSLQPKPIENVEPRFQCATCFLVRQTDGTYTWDNMAQHRATTALSKLMMWDQSILQTDPPLVFNFGNIQETPYEVPGDGPDLSAVKTEKDEVDGLTH